VEKYIMDIEAYLDGSMSVGEKAAFEKRLLVDAELRKELEQYQSLKADLDWHFAAKDVAAAEVLRQQILVTRQVGRSQVAVGIEGQFRKQRRRDGETRHADEQQRVAVGR
jgi:anti-sigma factor RsiW